MVRRDSRILHGVKPYCVSTGRVLKVPSAG